LSLKLVISADNITLFTYSLKSVYDNKIRMYSNIKSEIDVAIADDIVVDFAMISSRGQVLFERVWAKIFRSRITDR
jgi:hypothetical protein